MSVEDEAEFLSRFRSTSVALSGIVAEENLGVFC